MKKLSMLCGFMFVIAMMANPAFAQACVSDADCNPPLLCSEELNQCVECETSTDCVEGELCNDEYLCVDDVQMVSVDIKPGSCPSPLNVKSRGVLPVAILGSGDIDVTSIDPKTILITREGFDGVVPVAPIRYSYDDVGTPSAGELCDCDDPGEDDLDEDSTADGLTDLTLKFSVPELVDGLGLTAIESRETIALTLLGDTEDGSFRGEDCVKIINTMKWLDDILQKIKKPKKPKHGDQE